MIHSHLLCISLELVRVMCDWVTCIHGGPLTMSQFSSANHSS